MAVDVDSIVLNHPASDDQVVLKGVTLPFEDASVDLIVADSVLEHIERPSALVDEFTRVFRPGGWLAARTPNRVGYIAVAARLIPERYHKKVLARAQPERRECDIFPTYYRMNTLQELRSLFPTDQYEHYSYGHFSDPAYFGKSRTAISLMDFVGRLLPERFAPGLMASSSRSPISPLDPRLTRLFQTVDVAPCHGRTGAKGPVLLAPPRFMPSPVPADVDPFLRVSLGGGIRVGFAIA